MREMKDSGVPWIGEIPVDWDVTILSALFGERRHKNAGLIEHNLLSLSYGKIIKKDISSNEGLLPASFEAYNVVERGDIVLRLTDLQNDKRSLRTGLCTQRGIITSAYTTLAIRSDDDPGYMHYLLHAYDVCKVFYGMGDGVRQGMNYKDLKSLRIIHPRLAEQKRIAAYLDTKCAKIDASIAKQEQVIEKLKAYKLSVITEAVTKGLNPDVPMKDSGIEWIGTVPAHWDILKLRTHTRMLTPMRDRPERLDGDIPWVRIEDYDGKYISASKEGLGVSLETVQEMNLKIYPIGSILCTSSCDLGKCAIVTRELVSNQRFINIIPNSDTNSDYLYYLMLSNAERLNHLSTGTIQANLSRKAFEHLMVQFPPNSEQRAISVHLDRKCSCIDNIVQRKQALIDRLTEYKKSLIYEVVTGKRAIDAELPQITAVTVVSPELLKYMKAVLMTRIIDGLGNHVLGRVQVQKGLYFAETSSNPRLHLETDYARYTHGPFDREIWDYEAIMADHGWIYATDEQERTIYRRGEHFSEYWGEYQRLFPGCEETVQRVIDFVKTFQYTDGVEKAATLFAAWNDFIIDGVASPTDEQIIAEVRNHWTENKGRIKERTWKRSLARLRSAQFIPQGHGKHTVKWQGGQANG